MKLVLTFSKEMNGVVVVAPSCLVEYVLALGEVSARLTHRGT